MPLSSTSSYGTISVGLSVDVPNAGTVTVAYPTGTAQADYTGGNAGATSDNMAVIGQDKFTGATALSFSYGASNITVTNNTGVIWTAGTRARFSFPRLDPVQRYNGPKALI